MAVLQLFIFWIVYYMDNNSLDISIHWATGNFLFG